jgi:hypothetical protein
VFARLLPHPVYQVVECQQGMAVHHPGACISHHRADPLSHSWLVAMDRTPAALRLSLLVWAAGEPFSGIMQEIITILTETILSLVLRAALHPDHRFNGLILSCYARMFVRHCRLFDQITPWCINQDAARYKPVS